MLKPIFKHNKWWIDSVELYDLLGREKSKYGEWLNRRTKKNNSLEQGRDYYQHRESLGGWKNPHRAEYHFTIPLAMAILIREGTIVSKNLRIKLEETLKAEILARRAIRK
jgi:hypothetical protein